MEKIEHAVLRAASETLENLAFMELFPAREEHLSDQAELKAALLVHEPFQGEIRLAAPPALLEQIGQTVFGLPAAGVTLPDPQDLLAEILNTIAGRLLMEWLPENQPFRIGLPELDPPPACETDAGMVWNFRADGHIFTLSISNFPVIQSLETGS